MVMQKEDLQKIYNQDKNIENNLANRINNYERKLNKLKLSSCSYRVKTNLFVTLLILLGLSNSSLIFLIAENTVLSEVILTTLFGIIYGVSDFTYKIIVGKKYGVNLFKPTSEKESIKKEIEYNVKLEQIKNEDIMVKNSLSYLSKQIKACYNGLPLFSKNYYVCKNELEIKLNNLNEIIQEKKFRLNETIERSTVSKVSTNYSLINMFFHTFFNIGIGAVIIVSLPVLLNLTISSLFQIILGFILFTRYAVSKSITFKKAREVFNKYGINLMSLKQFGKFEDNEKKIKEESEELSKYRIEQIEVKTVCCSIECMNNNRIDDNLIPKSIDIILLGKEPTMDKGKLLIKNRKKM